ncbi:hypothetical protein C8T65DRAFT_580831 [Cerioporus squamosus]|nr:hypothetical protein C8T65DRAFT_580831 [Cerioporus squamosus]
MCEMMETLTSLREVVNTKAPDSDGSSVEDRLKRRMFAVIETIKRCAKACDTYHNRRTLYKFFASWKWEREFTEVAQQFVIHKKDIESDLQIHASIVVTKANTTLTAMSTSVTEIKETMSKLMKLVFERMRSPEERDLFVLVSEESDGIDAFLKNDKLVEELLAKHKTRVGIGKDKDEEGTKDLRRAAPDAVLTVIELRKEVNKEVEEVLADNNTFDKKFEALKTQLDEVKVVVRHESDRVIETLLAGPHERIVDRVSRSTVIDIDSLTHLYRRTCTIYGMRWYFSHYSSPCHRKPDSSVGLER